MLRWIILVIFAATYLFLCASKYWRARGLWVGVLLLMVAGLLFADEDPAGALRPGAILTQAISWNVLGVLAGAMLIADLFLDSGVPVLLADLLAERCRSTHWALLGVCACAGVVSAFVDNVTTVLLMAPVALAIVRRTGVNPVPVLVGLAVCANLQGAATLVGDPPSMLMAGYFHLNFSDFFIYQGRPSIFFAIQMGAIFGLAVLYWFFRAARAHGRHRGVAAQDLGAGRVHSGDDCVPGRRLGLRSGFLVAGGDGERDPGGGCAGLVRVAFSR
jgi:Na+/H+ antiporter NhaD/arsenite permease-like protein